MTIKKADAMLNALEIRATIYDYDIDADTNYKAACELVTAAEWEDRCITGYTETDFRELVSAVHTAIMEEV